MTKYMHKRPAPEPIPEGNTWTYWISRDSIAGVLAARCSLWCVKPLRTRVKHRVVWCDTNANEGHLGEYRIDEVVAWFRTYPETDIQLIVAETSPPGPEAPPKKQKPSW